MKKVIERITLFIVCSILFTACNRMDIDTENGNQHAVPEIKVVLSDFTGSADTRTQESSYQTSFTGNEQIGVFALKSSGNVVVGNNIPYEYDVSTGTWAPVNASDKVYVYDSGVTYYAYYPYSSTMNNKKSIAEISAAFIPQKNQSSYADYTASDLMCGAGTLSGNNLSFTFTHAMFLVEIEINETSSSSLPAAPNPVFHGINPWPMEAGKTYRYITRPAVAVEVGCEYGPEDNRYAFRHTLAADAVTAGNYIHLNASFTSTRTKAGALN